MVKERASYTFDKETIDLLEELMKDSKYRNKSHVVESAIKLLSEKEQEKKKEKERGVGAQGWIKKG